MKKIAINICYGGFSLSKKAEKRLKELDPDFDDFELVEDRENPHLIQVIEELGVEAHTRHSKLKIIEIPDDVDYTIEEYEGKEHVAEVHRKWRS